MAVNITPNIGLLKPTESELALNWARIVELADDNNDIVTDKMDINVITYTPTLVGPTTNPNIGAGFNLGEYYEIQGFIFGAFNIQFTNPGIVVGTGTGAYGIALPTLVDNSFHFVGTAFNNAPGPYACLGEGYLNDASSVSGSGSIALDVVRVGGVDYVRMMSEAYAGKTVEWYGPNVPFAVADGDQFVGQFFYKRA
jgi:hypothetical protein